MSIVKIEIGGKDRDFSFGLAFFGEALEHFDMDVTELGLKLQNNPFKYQPLIMFISAKHALELQGKEVDFSSSDVVSWIENEDGGIRCEKVQQFDKAFAESLMKNVPKENETDSKKKVKK